MKEGSAEYAKHFIQETIDERWIKAIVNCVGPWMADRNKSDWEIVRFTSIRMGILKEGISRKAFSEIIYTFCREILGGDMTPKKLEMNMGKCIWLNQMAMFDILPDAHLLRKLDKEIQDLIEKGYHIVEETVPTIEKRLQFFFENRFANDSNKKIRMNPYYSDIVRPQLSIEYYDTESFFNRNEPSFIRAYECVNERVTVDKVWELHGRYTSFPASKLSIVSPFNFNQEVMRIAAEHKIQLIMIDPKKEITEKNFILSRNDDSTTFQQMAMAVLQGFQPMDTSVLIFDNFTITTSISESLWVNGFYSNQTHTIHTPFIPDKTIERMAETYTSIRNEEELIKRLGNGDMSINIKEIAQQLKLSYVCENMQNGHVGQIDLHSQCITLDSKLWHNRGRLRFTMGHEIGHFVLHRSLFSSCGYTSTYADNDASIYQTNTICDNDIKRMEIQANKFSSALLMPKEMVCFAINKTNAIGKLYSDNAIMYWDENEPSSMQECNRLIHHMAELFHVSATAMRIRLVNLGFIVEGAKPKNRELFLDF